MILLKILFLFGIIGGFSFLFIWWLCFNYRGETKLKLKLFRQIYNINPSRWNYIERYWDDYIKHLYYGSHRIKLTFITFCYFQLNRIFFKISEERKEKRDTLIWILEDCQADIKYLKEQADREVKRALEEQKKIFNNWN